MDLISQYRELHEVNGWFAGKIPDHHVEQIADLIKQTGSTTLLDYGSGKGKQYLEIEVHKQWGGFVPVCYDPGYYPYSLKPTMQFDGVICTDVAEHIPTKNIHWFLSDVIGYATKFVFLTISTTISKKELIDGRSVHITVKPQEWWLKKISEVKRDGDLIVVTLFDDRKPPGHVKGDRDADNLEG